MTPLDSAAELQDDGRQDDTLPLVIACPEIPLPREYQALLEEANARCPGRVILPLDGDPAPMGGAGQSGHPLQWVGVRRGAEVLALAALRGRGEVADLVTARNADPRRVLPPLLAALERLARARGAAEIEFFLPDGEDGPPAELMEDAGYRTVEIPATTLQVIDWPAFLRALDTADPEPGPEMSDGDLTLEIHSGGFGPPAELFLQLNPTPSGVRPHEVSASKAGGALRLNASSLASWLLGGPPDRAFPGVVTASAADDRIPAILRRLRLAGRWSTPLGHRR